ncbi:MAG TPA: ribonuclease D [Actinomycetota bacterium]|nr:ribonuclease D [Actinomycetota bacterium]
MTSTLITSNSEIAGVADSARAAGRIGLDTEFMRERTYRARLCLVQIATPEGIHLIDAVAAEELKPVAELIADERVEIVLHAGRQDLEIFYERFELLPTKVFDVQLAAAFAAYGSSLPYGRLVQAITGARLTKGESYSDWCRRPLSAEQLRYAADDVAYLLDMSDRLKQQLAEQGRARWAEEEMAIFEAPETYVFDPDAAYRKVSGRGSLSGRQMTILRSVARWREETAQKRDIPRGWVIKDPTLVEIARRAPADIDALKRLRGMNASEAERSGREILAAIEAGKGGTEIEQPKALSRAAQIRSRMLAGPADAIVRARCEAAGIATELVSTRGELEALLADVTGGIEDLGRHRMMQGWRRTLAGDHVVAFARGDIAIRASDSPPYVEEIPLGGS